MLPDSSQIFASPDYHCLGLGEHHASFVEMDREHYRQSIFLDRRLSPKVPSVFNLPLSSLAEAGPQSVKPPSWIFHIAHCGSTLLANLLDQPGQSLALREPPALRQIGIERTSAMDPTRLSDRLSIVHRLCARRYSEREVPVIKANVPVNFILDLIDGQQRQAPAVMLYLDWRAYLLAILRTDNHRAWLHRITDAFRQPIERETGQPLGSASSERAAALWLTQMRLYAGYLGRNANAAVLNTQRLFDDPVTTASVVAQHLGLEGVEPSRNAAQLGTYSKDPSRSFDSDERRARALQDEQRLAGELAQAEAWLDQAASGGIAFAGFEREIAAG